MPPATELVVHVTTADISRATHTTNTCPIATAIRRSKADVVDCSVGRRYVEIVQRDGTRHLYIGDRHMQGFVRRFDRGSRTTPCALRLMPMP